MLFCVSISSHAGETWKVIVHPDCPVESLTRAGLQRIFLKKIVKWPGGAKIRPVDQKTPSAVRTAFSRFVLLRTVSMTKTYWRKEIFSGSNAPPRELSSDRAVLEYVRSHPGAIGYISSHTSAEGVKVISIK